MNKKRPKRKKPQPRKRSTLTKEHTPVIPSAGAAADDFRQKPKRTPVETWMPPSKLPGGSASKQEAPPPSNPLAAKQRIAAGALSLGPIEKLEEALSEGRRFIYPFSIKDMLTKHEKNDVLAVVGWARDTANWISPNDPAKAAEGLCQFTFELVEKLHQLDESGALRSARKRIPKWPQNVDLAGVGTEANIATRPASRAGTRQKREDQEETDWRKWVVAACEAARYNERYYLAFLKLRGVSKPKQPMNIAPKRMRKTMAVESYLTPGGRLLLWPWWLNDCFAIPDELRTESLGAYKKVVEGLLLWHLVFHNAMKDGAALLGEELHPPRGSKAGGKASGGLGVDYDPILAGRIRDQIMRTLVALSKNSRTSISC